MAEYEINLENLVKMKRVFEEADGDGSGELDPDEFYEKLGPYLGQGLSPAAVAQLFMRIDADCGGTIDWEEFINYFFLQRAAPAAGEGGDEWRLQAEDHWRKEWRGAAHKEAVERLFVCGATGQYITGGRGGPLRVWNGDTLAPVQVLGSGTGSSGWVTDCALLEGAGGAKKLVVAAQDRTMTFYDPVRTSWEYCSRLACPGSMGPPLCLAQLQRDGGVGVPPPRLVWGDTEGAVMLLRAEPPPLHSERPLAPRRDYEVVHSGHTDWVTHLEHIPDVGDLLVSSSLDATLRMTDLERGVAAATVTLHKKGVRTFAYSPAFSLVASAGVERSVLLWQPKGNVNRKVGELPGHSAGISRLLMADEQSQVITLSDDHVVRLWDLRTHKCVQAIGHADWPRPEDSKPTAVAYDSARRRLVCASHRPASWAHKRVEVERQHDSRLVGALYNQTFSVVVSGDEGGTICMWNLQSGRREGGFQLWASPGRSGSVGAAATGAAPTAPPKLTAMAFDANQRRLLAASDAGAVRCYNFNSGAVLREFLAARGDRRELTAVAFVPPPLPPAEEEEEEEGGEGEGAGEGCAAGVEDELAGSCSGGGYSELSEHALMLHQQEASLAAQRASQQHAAASHASGSQTQRSGTGSAGSADGPPPLVLAAGWGRSLCVWEEGEEERVTRCRRLAGHAADVLCMAPLGRDVVATGDFDGEVRVWHLPSGACLATCACGGPEFERAVRRLCWLPLPAAADGSCAAPLLAAAGDDGGLQLWSVPVSPPAGGCQAADGEGGEGEPPSSSSAAATAAAPAAARLVARLAATHRRQDCLTSLRLDAGAPPGELRLWAGDSSGHVALWDLTALLLPTAAGQPAAEAPAAEPSAGLGLPASLSLPACGTAGGGGGAQRLAHWRAVGASVVGLDLLQGAGEGLLLVGGQDAAISVWTRQGGLVGVFGRHSWDLEDPATWQDPRAAAPPPPLPAEECAGQRTPREIIARTPRRGTCLERSAAGGGSGAQTARHDVDGSAGSGSLEHTALPSARCLHSEAAERPGEVLSRLAQLRLQEGRASDAGGGASPLANQRRTAHAHDVQRPLAAAPSLVLPPGEASAAPSPASSQAFNLQLLSDESAGARLSALASATAASKADRWTIPVHVQAHSVLALQRMDEVPADAAGMWAQVKTCAGSAARAAGSAAGKPRSTSPPASAASIAAILGRAPTAFGRRSSQHQHQQHSSQQHHQG